MIKLFGKIRYHWQPEFSLMLIYWSITLIPFFFGLILLLEKTTEPWKVFSLAALTLLLGLLGIHRYFIIHEDGILEIASFNVLKPKKISISQIEKMEITKTSIRLVFLDKSSRLYCMRKWDKKYFLDALAINPYFKGEVELLDNFIELDYFEHYREDKKAPTL
ncbi:EbsA family protein [Streptococcus caprae]|uniref:EbsA family protein n=1 Tax=Streptococcus caprae TaxID=1640501 RepID=A0ABV8CWL8_9STRE